ncbi:MAG: PQQ-dependent sugar dehydrogenase [Nitrososphaeraceae archaeon]
MKQDGLIKQISLISLIIMILYSVHEYANVIAEINSYDENIIIQEIVDGLDSPTSMLFIDEKNIIVLEKETGFVKLVKDEQLQDEPIYQVKVNDKSERGLLGITKLIQGNETLIYLYYTEEQNKNIKNTIYMLKWDGKTLLDENQIIELPGEPGPNHNGGKIKIGPDNYLYAVIGDLNHRGKLQNFRDGNEPDDTGVILRIDPKNGSSVNDNPFIDKNNKEEFLDKYYAYGIRNSFGMEFDHITNKLWITENGPGKYDEINLVEPGFNSGWIEIMGPISDQDKQELDEILVNFKGSKYSDPEYSWKETIGVTDIEFLDSNKFGDKYNDGMFVGDINNGNIYFFELNDDRNMIKINNEDTKDLVADNDMEASSNILVTGFNGITDLETGPDGNLYVLSFDDGKIFKISYMN